MDIYLFHDERDKTLKLVAVNHNSLMHDIKEETISLTLQTGNATLLEKADLQRVDETHANALAAWLEMGSPTYLSEAQLASLHAASCLTREQLPLTLEGSSAALTITLPPQGMALITLYFAS